ncbi:peptidoglycan-associated lipoprotein Pal [Qipengyuania nanhaisediminis]|uniref:Peptidoglycan-associated lipoprotein n=1 Tax=Qipengyuania nanhaisediminis TaxID=604088 RepID=A0A1I5PCW9_9SPHN|nr:peptidoglycan-associated lipoprotein Pal [Qipengyuania nanhaisediminis]SFP31361.1 peptidoglycan-associated lipoprotein [Qipengyuania nanhaisediminis]
MSRVHTVLIALSMGLAVASCGKKKVETLPPAPGADASTGQSTSNQPIPGSHADFLAKMGGQDIIYFDTDRYNIDDIDAAALRSQANWLRQYPNKMARIEGHADERGTREYNLALGERRANAARNYLISIGIDGSRLAVVSYGKERPVALGSNEEAWQKNRRAATITID